MEKKLNKMKLFKQKINLKTAKVFKKERTMKIKSDDRNKTLYESIKMLRSERVQKNPGFHLSKADKMHLAAITSRVLKATPTINVF